MRKSVKGFTDAMLDLMVKDSVSNMVDFLNKDELIYLGPDEQVIPWDIDWIVNRAGNLLAVIRAHCTSSYCVLYCVIEMQQFVDILFLLRACHRKLVLALTTRRTALLAKA
jgi:hypothetical protein